ncbi:MAG: carboxypeptidase-like regulatory domain-containing protein, partial [Bacteroidota bacterium]
MFSNNLLKLIFTLSLMGWISLSTVDAQRNAVQQNLTSDSFQGADQQSTTQLIASNQSVSTTDKSEPIQSGEQAQLTKLLQNLREMYGISFMYEKHLLANQSVSAKIDAETDLETNLKRILKSTELRFRKINDHTYVIILSDSSQEVKQIRKQPLRKPSDNTDAVYSSASLLHSLNKVSWERSTIEDIDREISGQVIDENDDPLPGVNVVVKNTTVGTITDLDGNYRLTISDDAETLVFSSVGYTTEEVAIGNQTTINMAMLPDIQSLSEVVVTALGIEKDSRTLGYATSTVDPEEFTVNRTPNVMNALQGKIAGVNISSLGTGPGGTSKIRIRGQSSISGQNNPLIVINGVPIDNTNFGTNPRGSDPNAL